MDEASQCVEPEALVPLKLGMYFNNLRDFWSKKIDTKNKTYFYYFLHYFFNIFFRIQKIDYGGRSRTITRYCNLQ